MYLSADLGSLDPPFFVYHIPIIVTLHLQYNLDSIDSFNWFEDTKAILLCEFLIVFHTQDFWKIVENDVFYKTMFHPCKHSIYGFLKVGAIK